MTLGRRPLRPSDRRRHRMPRDIRRALNDAIAAAELQSCGADPAAQEAMRLYLTTWVVGPLLRVVEWADDAPARKDVPS